ncbi:MAG: DUF2510 domain-containing protein [Actinobacteria bacterium]|nr:DUF2510 domain-containing protein [Actinomycetota bacterium]
MSRYVKNLATGRSADEIMRIASEYLQSAGFVYKDERGEMCWRKGVGALAAPQFMKVEAAADGTAHIESWMAGMALMPGVYGGEMDPSEGAYGFAVKAALMKKVRELEARLGGTPVAGAVASNPEAASPGAVAAGWYPDPAARHEQRYWDGAQWTANVADAGQTAVDPQGAS